MIEIADKQDCCGCGACEQICPKKCIKLKEDNEGFLYPETNAAECVSCNMCESACPIIQKSGSDMINESERGRAQSTAYGGWHKNDGVRFDSSSGAAFTLVAEYIINEGGIVYGCMLNDNMEAVHAGIESMDELYRLRGSKYVQSKINTTYQEIKLQLQTGRKVLFVGTPCQAAGLHSFLGQSTYENLYIIDFICHGVPSPKLFRAYINELERKYAKKVVAYKFRNKDNGWNQTGTQLGSGSRIDFYDEAHIRKYPAFLDHYMNAFLDDVCLRPSCYACNFKDITKDYADFTIADFWGVNKVSKNLNDGKGTSLVLVHNDHAMELWNKVSDNFYCEQVDIKHAVRRNQSLIKSARMNPNRKKFYEELNAKGFRYVERRYMSAFTWGFHTMWKIFGQFIKFAIVGCSNIAINLAVYYLCLFLGINYLIAYTLGFLVSVCNAFFWNYKYVFVNKQETSIIKAFVKVVASYGFSFLLSLVLMTLLVEIFHISSFIAPVLKMIVTIPLNFVMNKIWAFKDRKNKYPEEEV